LQSKEAFKTLKSEQANVSSMASTRERRTNAGNRLSRLLEDEEQDDDFYKSTYGGI